MSRVWLESLSFSYRDAVPVLADVELCLEDGWTGLVGENGAGKSTLLRLIAGELTPERGRVRLEPAGASVVYCPQEVHEPGPELEAFAETGGAARTLQARLRLDPAGLVRWDTLSPGERKRWQLGAALCREPHVLLLDEPTNHVDAEARSLVVTALRDHRGVGVVVSHDRALLEGLTRRTLRLHGGQARLLEAAYGAARAVWESETRAAWDRRAAAQAEVKAAGRRLADARRRRAAAELAQSGRKRDPKDRDARTLGATTMRAWAEARLGSDVGRLRAASERAQAAVPEAPAEVELGRSIFVGYEPAPRPVLLSVAAVELRAGPVVVLRDVRARLERGQRVRLAGPNGAGKTTLLSALVAASTLPRERPLYLPQELSPGEARARLDEVRGLEPAARGRVLSLVAALGTDPARLLASARPSPGEARKLLLALGLGRHAWALVLDEPTNHLDLPTVERLEAALGAYPGAMLLVTHDDAFAQSCTDTVWTVGGGRLDL